jgi:ParB family transcriptional regulator, chromosome partitioning protein
MVKRPTSVPKMRGVEALLSQTPRVSPEDSSAASTQLINIKLPSSQPRKYFDPEKMQQLVQSVREHGILEPLLVRPISKTEYELVAGERRLRAAQEIGLVEVPIVIREMDDRQALQIALVENLQREDLNPVEETEGILQLLALALNIQTHEVEALLHQAYNAKQRDQTLNGNVTIQLQTINEMLAAVGKFNAESFRSNRLPLLKLPNDVLQALRQGDLEYTKAKVIARVKDSHKRQELLENTIGQSFSLTQVKDHVATLRVAALTPTVAETPSLQSRFKTIYQRFQKTKTWDNPQQQKRIEKLLTQLENMLEE